MRTDDARKAAEELRRIVDLDEARRVLADSADIRVVLDALEGARTPQITDEMVEAGARQWASGSPTPNNWEHMSGAMRGIIKSRFRAALEAALGQTNDANGEN